MTISLKGKRAVVAGGSRGIGRSIGLALAAAGAHVSICARGADGLKAAAAEIGKRGGQVHWGACDLASAEAIKRYVEDAAAALGGIDILVNNASGFGMADDEAGWAAGLNVDVLATVRASHAAIPHIEKAGGGAVVNISSISGYPVAGAHARRQAHPRERDRTRLDRVSGRRVGQAQDRKPRALPGHAQVDPLGPIRRARGDRQRGAVPGQRHGELGDRPDHHRRWWSVAELSRCRPEAGLILFRPWDDARLRFPARPSKRASLDDGPGARVGFSAPRHVPGALRR
jgi:hypothetical protein